MFWLRGLRREIYVYVVEDVDVGEEELGLRVKEVRVVDVEKDVYVREVVIKVVFVGVEGVVVVE